MVTRAYYDNEDPVFGRYSTRGHGYPLSHDRDLPTSHGPYGGSRNHQLSLHEARNSGQSSDQESVSSHPRRRIPVACGRCRKRKIRCSGDPGNGGPCSNCKAAGNEQCQFLRVLSTEAPMKTDTADFGYDSAPAVPRINCRMVPYGPQAYAPQAVPLGSDGFQYRHSSLSYPYQGKGYYGMPHYGEFGEESIDYGLQGAPYPLLNAEHMNVGSTYPVSGAGRAWTSTPQHPKNLLFLEQEQGYGHSQLSYPNNGYTLRSTISPESKSLSLNGMSNSLPTPIGGTDRVLPIPAHRPPFSRDGLPQTRGLDGMLPYSGLVSSNMMSSGKSLSSNSVSEGGSVSSSYQLSHSSPEVLPSTQMSYGSQNLPTSQQQNDIYDHGGHSRLYNSLSTSSSEDLRSGSYGVVSPGSKRPSPSDHDGSMDSPPPGDLANGHSYVPYQHQSYPAPPMEILEPVSQSNPATSIQAGA